MQRLQAGGAGHAIGGELLAQAQHIAHLVEGLLLCELLHGHGDLAAVVALAHLHLHLAAQQQVIDRARHVRVHDHVVPILDLHDHVEGGRGLALEHRFLGAPPPRLFVAQRHGLDAADEVTQRGVLHQIIERVAVRGADELHAALGDRARRQGLELRADLVDHDHLGHVVLDRLDHHGVLAQWRADLHAPGAPDARVRDIAVPGDLIGRIDHDDALVQVVGEHAGHLAQERGLADAGLAEQQNALARLHDIADNRDRAEDGPSDTAGQPDHLALAIADG